MNDHEINKRLADIIDLGVTEHVRGDRLVWLISGKQEWNPVEKIEQLWPLVKRFKVEFSRDNFAGRPLAVIRERVSFDSQPALLGTGSAPTEEAAIALAIINAHNPSREAS